jgi:hypothetical protein
MSTIAGLIAAVREGFAIARPSRFTVSSDLAAAYGDNELDLADSVFESRTPDSLQSSDVGISAGWPEVYLTREARDYFMPGFVRLILESDDDARIELDDFLQILSPDCIAAMNRQQRLAISNVLGFVRDLMDDESRIVIDRRLRRLRM